MEGVGNRASELDDEQPLPRIFSEVADRSQNHRRI